MANLDWFTIVIIVIIVFVSGAIGAAIHAAISAYRNRRQPISRRVNVFRRYKDTLGATCLRSQITLSDGQKEYPYDNLSIVDIQIKNPGDRDFEEFKLGLTLSAGDVAIYLEAEQGDRHHQIEQLKPMTFAEPLSEIDLILRPFNRGDTYSLRLLIVTSQASKEPGEIEFSSPLAVSFVNLPTVGEMVKETARSTRIAIGPFRVPLNK